ncbi:hypothetical protein [Acetobacter oeni]|uniref:hypothetical protein n=1 Tax=Acetobacter oeni TaxID=304077 RepID=UPI0011BFBFCA|nr:hypothetical protein [Acetobacter oeni]MBB3882365.1 hypothetical protein [Acetobacter oeni]NHO18533.1 hypothetical protein [Acetobacter oeni]
MPEKLRRQIAPDTIRIRARPSRPAPEQEPAMTLILARKLWPLLSLFLDPYALSSVELCSLLLLQIFSRRFRKA